MHRIFMKFGGRFCPMKKVPKFVWETSIFIQFFLFLMKDEGLSHQSLNVYKKFSIRISNFFHAIGVEVLITT